MLKVKIQKLVKTKNGRIMILSKCKASDSKKSTFIKDQEASVLLSSLTPSSKIPLVGSFFSLEVLTK